MINKVNLSEKLSLFEDMYSPKIVGELNGQYVKVVKFVGEYVWHSHEAEDEMFFVIKGGFRIELRDRNIELNEGEFCIIPRGTEHRPVADQMCHIMLFEPASTRNTGKEQHKYTIEAEDLERI